VVFMNPFAQSRRTWPLRSRDCPKLGIPPFPTFREEDFSILSDYRVFFVSTLCYKAPSAWTYLSPSLI
jgi:hypothetical protein